MQARHINALEKNDDVNCKLAHLRTIYAPSVPLASARDDADKGAVRDVLNDDAPDNHDSSSTAASARSFQKWIGMLFPCDVSNNKQQEDHGLGARRRI